MPTDGKFKRTLPAAPSTPEVGFIEEYINGVGQGLPNLICKIPDGLADPTRIPAIDSMVTFTKGNGQTASNVAVAVQLGILDFQAIANADGSHYMYWRTQGAVTARIDPGNINVSDRLPDGALTITNPASTPGYTLTVYDSAGNSNSAFDNI